MYDSKRIATYDAFREIADDPNTREGLVFTSTGEGVKMFTAWGVSSRWVNDGSGHKEIVTNYFIKNLTKDKDRVEEKLLDLCDKQNYKYYYVSPETLGTKLNKFNDPNRWANLPQSEKYINFGKYHGKPLSYVIKDLDYFVYMVYGSGWVPSEHNAKKCLEYIAEIPEVKKAVEDKKKADAKANREREEKDRKVALKRAKSQPVGKPGERMKLELTLVRLFEFNNYYGERDGGYILEDKNENQFIYFNSFHLPLGEKEDVEGYPEIVDRYLEVGETAIVNATIKKHNNSVKYGITTQLSRIHALQIGEDLRNQLNKKGANHSQR